MKIRDFIALYGNELTVYCACNRAYRKATGLFIDTIDYIQTSATDFLADEIELDFEVTSEELGGRLIEDIDVHTHKKTLGYLAGETKRYVC